MIRTLYRATRETPAEYESTAPAYCIVCDREHDLDDGDGFYRVEGHPAGDVICDTCHIACSECGEHVMHPYPWAPRVLAVDDGVQFEPRPVHGCCAIRREAQAALDMMPMGRVSK